MTIKACFIHPFIKNPVYFFHVLVEKSEVVPDTPSSSLYMIPIVTTYMILHQQLFDSETRKG